MKRHQALFPLSHHHHHTLVTAQKLKKVTSDQKLEDLAEEVRQFWQADGEAHFRDEEEVLLPLYALFVNPDQDVIKEMLVQHVRIRALVMHITSRTQPVSAEHFRDLGRQLEEHVRLEERVIFPMIEEAVPDSHLYNAEPQFHIDSRSGRKK